MTENSRGQRNIKLDLLRIAFAVSVIVSHAPQLTDGNLSREPLERLTHGRTSLGGVGVYGFFILSGFLIVQSWDRTPELFPYMRKRVLRIVPGYAVAAFLSTVSIGILAPGVAHFFRHLGWDYWHSVLYLGSPVTPPVFPGQHDAIINGSMWSITYEFRCYILVAVLGLCGLIRRVWLALTVLMFALFIANPAIPYNHAIVDIFGKWHLSFSMTAPFLLGGCFYLFRSQIPFHPVGALLAIILLAILGISHRLFEPVMIVSGAYLLFYFAEKPWTSPTWLNRMPDISYGVYLYGWPVTALWIWYFHGSPWITATAATIICCLLGALSWHYIEAPALTLKRRR